MLNQVLSYLHYKIFSWHKNGHGVHSPYLYKMVTECFRNARSKSEFQEEELIRKKLLKQNRKIKVSDFGAGSKKLGAEREVKTVVKVSASPAKYCRLLAQLVKWSGSSKVLELGTSAGIGSLYLSKYSESLHTVEGCGQTALIAKENLSIRTNCKVINSTFKDALAHFDEQFDLIFVDGNHTYEGTKENFELISPLVHEQTIVVFDDINWSEGMLRAWNEICLDPRVRVSVDLWKMGIVLFRPEMRKEHIVIRY